MWLLVKTAFRALFNCLTGGPQAQPMAKMPHQCYTLAAPKLSLNVRRFIMSFL